MVEMAVSVGGMVEPRQGGRSTRAGIAIRQSG